MREVKQRALRHLNRRMAERSGVTTLDEALAVGLTAADVRRLVAAGSWIRVHPRVYRSASAPSTPHQQLMAALRAGGPAAVASHQSAAWLWGLLDRAPDRPSITVPRNRRPRLRSVDLYRRDSVDYRRVRFYRGVRCTDPLWTIVDLAAVMSTSALDDAIDRGLARRLINVAGLEQELLRRQGRGRRGIPRLRQSLRSRGLIGAPTPSVLESRTLRLLHVAGIEPLGVEVVASDDWYRVDVQVAQQVMLEVAGHAYHWSPEQRSYDEERRNRLTLSGARVLTYTWWQISYDQLRVIEEITLAIQTPA